MTQTLDRSQARLALEICRYTYAVGAGGARNAADREDALAFIRQHSTPAAEPIAIQDASGTSFACVMPYADRNIVSYMGTESEFDVGNPKQFLESLSDWKENGRAAPTSFTLSAEHLGKEQGVTLPGQVHRGFLAQLKAVQADVIRALDAHGGRQRPVIITGHSQGGAEAALATAALAAAGFSVEMTYTFAAPRAGTAEFARAVTSPVHRFEFGDDVVPHLPPTLIRHVLEETLTARIEQLPFLLKKAVQVLLNEVINHLINVSYVGLGSLCYGSPGDQRLHVGLNGEAEKKLFTTRVTGLKQNSKNWGDHHHLAGTSADVAAGHRGTYTALVSDWPIA
ncbi:MAG: lipase family protein [Planctomycetaceae bacterium]|nr:lipase family protein [Planctomycetaceae bacterium]